MMSNVVVCGQTESVTALNVLWLQVSGLGSQSHIYAVGIGIGIRIALLGIRAWSGLNE